MKSSRAFLVYAGLVLAVACAPPVEVRRTDARRAQQLIASNALTTGKVSRRTRNLLYNFDLIERYQKDPAGALAELHAAYVAGRQPVDVASLSELAFHHAEHGGGSPYYLASALYAWAFLFPDPPALPPGRFDSRLRIVCDLYNRALTNGLKQGKNVALQSGTYPLPFGALDLTVDPETLRWEHHPLRDFVPVAEFEVKGFPTYYRWPGLGAPLAAGIVPQAEDRDLQARRARVPVTAVLRPVDLTQHMQDGHVQAAIELYPGYGDNAMTVNGMSVPLEAEPTATFALTLAETNVWQSEMAGFLHGMGVIDERARLVSIRPYRPGLIPLVLVHGTGSSAARWADLANELDNDPRIHAHYQLWFFSYETGNPIPYSSMVFRESLEKAVKKLDPDGRDPALRRMVVMGHSQGGLLTKMTVVESGDAFWQNVSKLPFDSVQLSDSSRDLLRRALFVHPLPFVSRVIFLATPHHGSYVAGSWLAHQVARLVRVPLDVTRVVSEFATVNKEALAAEQIRGAPTAVDNMTPKNRFVKALAGLPIAPGVVAHSIIAVKNPGPPQGQDDGVVQYDSAHIDGVASEFLVVSPHSCQSNPHTIAEVRRILLEHLAAESDAVPNHGATPDHPAATTPRAQSSKGAH